MEESLRLVTLPGENEGRSYYFRRLRICGVPANGDRSSWLESFQRALLEAAASAVKATDPRAPHVAAVYFQGETEALEMLLHRLVAGGPAAEWFWPAVLEHELEAEEQTSDGARSLIPQIIERLRAREASWAAVAMALFAAVEPLDPVRLLAAIPPSAATRWLEEVPVAHGARRVAQASWPAQGDPLRAISRAVETFGTDDVRTLWLATMALIFEAPGVLTSGVAVAQAGQLIKAYVKASCAGREACATNPTETEPYAVPETPSASKISFLAAGPTSTTSKSREGSKHTPASGIEPYPANEVSISRERSEPVATTAAGLIFLVNILDRLGIAEAAPTLGIQVLHRLAAQTGVPAEDPIALWLATLEDPTQTPGVRAWSIAVHRYIRLIDVRENEAPLTARDIVNRPGLFSVNRTDLDITLPLDGVDIRIRRAGLDLDPGWRPWFGRVVRFHYE